MFKFSKRSLQRLNTVHPDLRQVVIDVMEMQVMDFTVLEGIRSIARQEQLVRDGFSKTYKSKHLDQGDGYSHAVDIAPWPINWKDTSRFYILNGLVRAAAFKRGVAIRSGADWDGDGLTGDQSFHDLPHYELTSKGKA